MIPRILIAAFALTLFAVPAWAEEEDQEYAAKLAGRETPRYNQFQVVTYEQLMGCGYDPQKSRFECTLRIKRVSGYGGDMGAGSYEYVLFCVDWNMSGVFSNAEAVGTKSLHVHDEAAGNLPPWDYAVGLDFMPQGGVRTSDDLVTDMCVTQTQGPTYAARAILSWNRAPLGCEAKPTWGNVVNFRVRFDPER